MCNLKRTSEHSAGDGTHSSSVQLPEPTSYQDVNAALNLVLSNIQAILADQFIGLYFGGSLALGDFSPHRSDIDFTTVTVDRITV